MKKADVGLIGLAVMGENLAMNMAGKGFTVAVYNRTTKKVDDFVTGRGRGILGTHSLEKLVDALKRPRVILLMVQAGGAVDSLIEGLIPLLQPGDVIIDGGNALYSDTERRVSHVESRGLSYIGAGISGGEEGALNGPSIMPGGSIGAWERVRPLLQGISAKAGAGDPCCAWIGPGGAGHFVKMVHNGIEYGDMQIIGEAYQLMRDGLGMTADEIQSVFARWNTDRLESYLIEITADILAFRDGDGAPLVDKILDQTGQKGTGKWTVAAAMEHNVALPLITQSVFSRFLSSAKGERTAASTRLIGPNPMIPCDRQAFIHDLEAALYAAKIVSYAQGFSLLRAASRERGWNLDFGRIALIWRGGCIIRSAFLDDIHRAYQRDPGLPNLMLDDHFATSLQRAQQSARRVCSAAITHGLPAPAMTSALAYYDSYRCDALPANLLQAQRDYFGAHTYARTDRPAGAYFHTNWTGKGGETASTGYSV